MPKYRYINSDIEALQWTGENDDEVVDFTSPDIFTSFLPERRMAEVESISGNKRVRLYVGDWLVKNRSFYHCIENQVFVSQYELVQDD